MLQALELKPTDKFCLVARSKCYLQLGDNAAALRDSEAALEEDKEFNKVCCCDSVQAVTTRYVFWCSGVV